MQFLIGKRTYITSALMAGLAFAQMSGFISTEQATAIATALAALGLSTVRAAISNSKPVDPS
jgi:Tfp pilus assembly protein FimT